MPDSDPNQQNYPPENESPKSSVVSFWTELKRRKVMRVAIAYAVVAWILIQVTAIIFPQFNIPAWGARLVTLLLAIGFPVALIITWAFELTPDGIKTTKNAREARGGQPVSKAQQSKRNWFAVTLAAGVPTLIFGSLAVFFFLRSGGGNAVDFKDKSIAVLPFTAFSTEEAERFFADGLSDTLLHKLAQLSDIRVISRSSSFQYRGEAVDVRKVGEELKVSTVLEGSVQRSGERLRIIAQLINTADGSHVWSKTFDRSARDTFAIQDEIADAVVASLEVETSEEEKQRLGYKGTDSVEAYTLLNLIRESLNSIGGFNVEQTTFEAGVLELVEDLDRVLEIDPNYAEVYRVKADFYNAILFRGTESRDLYLRKGFEAIRHAMLLDPGNPYNFTIYADMVRRGGDPETGETFARLALSRAPNDRDAVTTLLLSLLEQNKNPEEKLELSLREEALGGGGLSWRRRYFALRDLGRYEEALEVISKELRRDDLSQLAVADMVILQSDIMGRHVETMRELIALRARLGDAASSTFWEGWLQLGRNVGLVEEALKIKQAQGGSHWQGSFDVNLLWDKGQYQEAIDWLDARGWEWHSARAKSYLMLGRFQEAADQIRLEEEKLGETHPYLVNNEDFSLALSLIVSLRKIGENEAADRLLDAVNAYVASRSKNGQYDYPWGYRLCVFHLLNGETARALEEMKKRIYLDDDGYVPLSWGGNFSSPEFESVKDDPTFKSLVSEYERRRDLAASKVSALIQAAGY